MSIFHFHFRQWRGTLLKFNFVWVRKALKVSFSLCLFSIHYCTALRTVAALKRGTFLTNFPLFVWRNEFFFVWIQVKFNCWLHIGIVNVCFRVFLDPNDKTISALKWRFDIAFIVLGISNDFTQNLKSFLFTHMN